MNVLFGVFVAYLVVVLYVIVGIARSWYYRSLVAAYVVTCGHARPRLVQARRRVRLSLWLQGTSLGIAIIASAVLMFEGSEVWLYSLTMNVILVAMMAVFRGRISPMKVMCE